MRKISYFLLLFVLLTFIACSSNKKVADKIDIYALNDLHGGILRDIENGGKQLGLANISNFIHEAKKENKNTIFLATGDMYQGSLISNYYKGKATVDIMNTMGFDAMVIGNHEFDWGIDEILKYHDGDKSNGEANFPLLAANIINKETKEKLPNTKDYIIVEKGQVKVGIIGTIGFGLENDILETNVKDYQFLDPSDTISNIAYDLRTNKNVNVIVALTHDNGDYLNNQLGRLDESRKIDAIFNAHYHALKSGSIYRGNNMIELPYIQSGSYGQYVGKISLGIDKKTKEVKDFTVENINSHKNLDKEYSATKEVVIKYQDLLSEYINTPLAKLKYRLYKNKVCIWMSDLFKKRFKADIGFQNSGGVKGGAFYSGVDQNDLLTMSKLFEIMPHDNLISYCMIKGKDVKVFINHMYESGGFSSNVTMENGKIFIDKKIIEDEKVYKFITNDYVFEKDTNPFKSQAVIERTNIIVRDLLVDEIKKQDEKFGEFNIYGEILTDYED